MGKPPKLLEPLDCPNASKFAKSAFAEFWAVNGKEQHMLMNMKTTNENTWQMNLRIFMESVYESQLTLRKIHLDIRF